MNDAHNLNEEVWMKLITRKEEFRRIVSVLNGFYRSKTTIRKLNGSQKMRIRLEKKDFQNFEVFLKKIGDHDFLIFLKIENKYDSWIHIDGIQEERERFILEGKTDHPVFKIVCISDLYRKDCVFAKREETKTFSSQDSA
ncbi:hypothetical protein AB3N59_01165 [Leptospira sp. WS92.C1]